MWNRPRQWLNDVVLHDPIERQQAALVQIILIGLVVSGILGLPLAYNGSRVAEGRLLTVSADLLVVLFTAGALATLRRGHFRPSVLMATTGLLLALALNVLSLGLHAGAVVLTAFILPIALVGLLVGRRSLFFTITLSVMIVIITAVLENRSPPLAGFGAPQGIPTIVVIGTFAMIVGLVGLFLDRVSVALRSALTAALAREQELEGVRASLETTIAERTAALQEALRAVEQREAHLGQALDDLRTSQVAVRELSAPVIPVLPGVLVAPLIGALDSTRAAVIAENVLGAVERLHARQVIFDITGVPVVDTQVAQVLIRTAAAVQLLGAQVLLVGIRPEVAQTLVALSVDLRAMITYPDLQQAVATLLAQRNDWGRRRDTVAI